MKDRLRIPGRAPLKPWLDAEREDAEREALARPAILLVEDDDDIRELLVTLLRLARFEPHACRTAEEALEQLREQQFDLVLTDYMLPHRTGGWLLEQATQEGLLEGTPALLVTAHPSPEGVGGHEVIFKPFDLDHLVDRVRQRLEGSDRKAAKRGATRQTAASRAGRKGDGDGDGAGAGGQTIELILYVSSHSPRSMTAIENIRQALSRHKSKRVKLTVCDLSENPAFGKDDAIAFTPTLEKRSPGPRTFILGHITNPDLVLELLDGCEGHLG